MRAMKEQLCLTLWQIRACLAGRLDLPLPFARMITFRPRDRLRLWRASSSAYNLTEEHGDHEAEPKPDDKHLNEIESVHASALLPDRDESAAMMLP
jgi:hypothetical protein